MAIYHFSAQVIGRSGGRSAVAAAAYRSGDELTRDSDGKEFDYTRKRGVDHEEIMKPEGSPEWMGDRQQLWNRVEEGEKRKDAQLAREVNVALPRELDADQQRYLLRCYVQDEFVDRGMVADVAIHHQDSHNPHAHVMLTMREIDGDGFGLKNRDWNSTETLQGWRESWQHHANEALEAAGHDARIDHRTLEAQGIDRAPGVHQGEAAHMQARGEETRQGDRQAEVNRDNEFREAFNGLESRPEVKETDDQHRVASYEMDEGERASRFADWQERVYGHSVEQGGGRELTR